MPVHLDQLMSAIAILADEKEIKLTVKQSGKGALICGGMSFLGKFLLRFEYYDMLESTVN